MIDLSKSWKDHYFETNFYEDIVNIKNYMEVLHTSSQGARGVLGNLVKKDLVENMEDETNGENLQIMD